MKCILYLIFLLRNNDRLTFGFLSLRKRSLFLDPIIR